jgi:hypothetical protein
MPRATFKLHETKDSSPLTSRKLFARRRRSGGMFVMAVPGAAAAATGGGGRRRPAHPGRRSGRRHQRTPGIAEGTEHIISEHQRAKMTDF